MIATNHSLNDLENRPSNVTSKMENMMQMMEADDEIAYNDLIK